MNEPSNVVANGYDRMADAYLSARDLSATQPPLERFADLLPSGGTVLDIGCGAGIPTDRYLVDRGFHVVGIDISMRQIELARNHVPEGRYDVRDMLSLTPGELRVDGIVSLFAIFHTPREHHANLLTTFASLLARPGALLITMGASDWQGTEPDFFGVEMYWSHFGPGRNGDLVVAAGFEVVSDEIRDLGPGERHQFILAMLH